MARKKPARPAGKAKKQAKKKTASKSASRMGARKSAKKAARKSAAKRSAKPAGRRLARKVEVRAKARPKAKGSAAAKPKGRVMEAVKKLAVAAVSAGVSAVLAPKKKPNLDRPRKTVADVHGIPSSLDMPRTASSAKSGRAEMKDRLSKNTGSGPAITAGDVDADWESAETVGDEAPGGDNPTPDQDVVDDIGRALGVEYDDDEELQGGAEISNRDRNRWELDPASKDTDEDEE
ncbi:MAG TPA: DUF6335 family protein [Vicinamibacterales bacterium]|nr:DUF6335 family protein [Vicinamibacterales bacterium]